MDIDKLRGLAEKATPGKWFAVDTPDDGHMAWVADGPKLGAATIALIGCRTADQSNNDAAYIAALSPEVIIALLDERDAMRAECRNIATASRFNRTMFDDDTAFADWAQSRCRAALASYERENGK